MEGLQLTFDLLPVLGGLMVFANWYFPEWKKKYDSYEEGKKQRVNAEILGAVMIGALGLSALGVVDVYSGTTWQEWIFPPIVDLVIALAAQAGVYKAFNKMVGK